MKITYPRLLAASLAWVLGGCTSSATDSSASTAAASTPAQVAAHAQTRPNPGQDSDFAVVALPATDGATSRLVSTVALHGLQVQTLDDKHVATTAAGDAGGVAISYGFDMGGHPATVVASVDATDNSLRLFTLAANGLIERGAHSIPLGFSVEGVCLLRNRMDGALYALTIGAAGEVDQHVIYATAQGTLDAREVRRVHFPSKLKQCVADDADGSVFVAEQGVGIWRFNGNPEADLDMRLVDARHIGHLEGKAEGVALYDGGKGSRWLLATNGAGRINVYDRSNGDALAGSFAVTAVGAGKPLDEPGTLFATSAPLGTAYPHGVLLVGDADHANQQLVSIADIASALQLDPGTPTDPRRRLAPDIATVTALVETAPVANPGDAADDPAIWADPGDPSRSLVIGTNKKAGMYVYDMQGKVLQFRSDGKMNNTDLREGFMLDGKSSILVTASDRTRDAVAIYRLDTDARALVDVADGVQKANLGDPYGLCMYRSARSGATYVLINTGSGLMRQWQLVATAAGKVRAKPVRDFHFDTQVEGCAADDGGAALYVDEEDVALWTLPAEPGDGTAMTAIDRIDRNRALKSDLEGLGIYHLDGHRGYVVISVQGNNTYAVYRLEGDHAYLGSFAVVADAARGIDGISETDGLEVTNRNLGPGFEHGAMIAQDGRNVLPQENQNYKYVPWESIAKALHLEMRP